MGEPPEGQQRLAGARRRVPPPCTTVARGRQRVGEVVRERRGAARRPRRARRRCRARAGRRRARWSRGGVEPEGDLARAAPWRSCAGHDRVVGVADRDLVRRSGPSRAAPWRRRSRRGVAWLPTGSRWSGARLSQVPTSGANRCEWSSRNDDASTTNTSTAGSSIAATSGTSVLPTATARRPPASSIARASSVTVVLPSVPVTATTRPVVPPGRQVELRQHGHAAPRRAASNTGWWSGTPGLGTTAPTSSTSARSAVVVGRLDERHARAPRRAARPASVGRSSTDDRALAVGDERPQHGLAGDAEPEHEVVGQSSPPVPTKSA